MSDGAIGARVLIILRMNCRLGNWYLICVDLGFALPLGADLRTASGEPGKIVRNQRVGVHLAMGVEWVSQGRPRRIPNKLRAMSLDAKSRSAETHQSRICMDVCDKPMTRNNADLYSLARDVTTLHHDLNFQDINLFLCDSETAITKYIVRILDLERQNN